jgi:hypothetical protein
MSPKKPITELPQGVDDWHVNTSKALSSFSDAAATLQDYKIELQQQ